MSDFKKVKCLEAGEIGQQKETWDSGLEDMGHCGTNGRKRIKHCLYHMPRISVLDLLMKRNHAVKGKECLACFCSALKLKVRISKERIEVRTFLSQI